MAKKILILILFDQITKLIFWNRDFLFWFLHIHSVQNFGLGFSLNFGLLNNLIVISAAVVFFVYYYWRHHLGMSRLGRYAFALIIAGAVSNIADRLYLGYVRDFLDIGLGFTFNLADAMIIIGLILVLFTKSLSSDKMEL